MGQAGADGEPGFEPELVVELEFEFELEVGDEPGCEVRRWNQARTRTMTFPKLVLLSTYWWAERT